MQSFQDMKISRKLSPVLQEDVIRGLMLEGHGIN